MIERSFAFDNSGDFIFKKNCQYAPIGHGYSLEQQTGHYCLYSATGRDGTWHLRAHRAWADLQKQKICAVDTNKKLFAARIGRAL